MKPIRAFESSAELSAQVKDYVQSAYADNTKLTYQFALERFYAAGYQMPASPEQIAEFISTVRRIDGKHYSAASINTLLAAIAKAHKLAGHHNPCDSELVRATFKGFKRKHGTAQRQAKPVLYHDLLRLIDTVSAQASPAKFLRDRALILVWWTGLFRRSEIVSLRIEHIEFSEDGATVFLPRSKTDQEGQGRRIGIPRSYAPDACPAKALEQLIAHLGDRQGAIFRNLDRANKAAGALTDVSANRILKAYAKQAGLEFERISGHSMRSGGATEAARRGVDLWKLQQHGGWKDARMLTERYIRGGRLFADNPMSFI